jgi:hypothetical protein
LLRYRSSFRGSAGLTACGSHIAATRALDQILRSPILKVLLNGVTGAERFQLTRHRECRAFGRRRCSVIAAVGYGDHDTSDEEDGRGNRAGDKGYPGERSLCTPDSLLSGYRIRSNLLSNGIGCFPCSEIEVAHSASSNCN